MLLNIFLLLSPNLNEGFVSVSSAVNPGKMAHINPEGNVITVGFNVVNEYISKKLTLRFKVVVPRQSSSNYLLDLG